MYDKAVEAQTQAFKTFMKTEVGKALERHRQALERWLSAQLDTRLKALEKQVELAVERAISVKEQEAQGKIRELKMRQARLNDEMSNKRSFKNNLSGRLLVDLVCRAA